QAAIDLHRDAAAQAVQHQRLLRFRQTDLPGRAGMGERGQRRCARAAFESGDRHMIGTALGDAGRDRSDTHLRYQLDRDARLLVDAFQIADQLRQILDGIDVVMRRRRYQADARRGVAHRRDVLVDLVTGKLAAFSGLGALCHLDLDVVGVDQILGGHAEAARGDLLDLRAHRIAVGQRRVAVGFLAAFARVRAAANAVHRDGERRVRLAADRAEAHGTGGEALDDLHRRLNLVERYGLVREFELHQSAKREKPFALLVDAGSESLVVVRCIAAHRVLEPGNRLRGPGVVLAAQAVGVVAADVEHAAVDRIVAIGVAMPPHAFGGNLLDAETFYGRGRAGEVFVDEG